MNVSVSSTPPMAAPVPRRRWWLRAVVLMLTLLVAVPILTAVYMVIATRNAWNDVEAETDALDHRWRLAEIEVDHSVLPDNENSALLIMAVIRKGGGVYVSGVPNYDKVFDKLPPNAQLNAQQLQIIRAELAKIAKPLQEIRPLKDMPRGRFPVTYADDFMSTLIPEHQKARQLGDWLSHEAMLLAHDDRGDEAIEVCQTLVNVGRALKDDPFLISLLIRAALQRMAIQSLERVLAQGEPSDATLKAMQTMLGKEINDSGWMAAVRGERAGAHHLFDNIRQGKVKNLQLMRALNGKGPVTIADRIRDRFPSTVLAAYPEYLRHMNRVVEISKLPIHERGPKLQEWGANKNSSNPIISMMAPPLGGSWPLGSNCHRAECRSQALLRSAMVALASERYRRNYGKWPAALGDLVQAKLLDAIPADPLDGQPLRYRRKADHVVIYSIGIDLIDNHGNIDHEQANTSGMDIGFRVWNVDDRRRDPLPPVALPE